MRLTSVIGLLILLLGVAIPAMAQSTTQVAVSPIPPPR